MAFRARILASVASLEERLAQGFALRRPAVLRNPLQVFRRQHALGQRRKHDRADAQSLQRVEQAVVLDPAVEHRIARLMDDERRAERTQDRGGFTRALRIVGRDADIERLARAHGLVQRAHGLLQRRLGIEAVRIEDIDIVDPHALEALVEARQHIFAAAPFAIGAGPHVVAGLARDDEFVAVSRQNRCAISRRMQSRRTREGVRNCWRDRNG